MHVIPLFGLVRLFVRAGSAARRVLKSPYMKLESSLRRRKNSDDDVFSGMSTVSRWFFQSRRRDGDVL
jgi:hypothetical protein